MSFPSLNARSLTSGGSSTSTSHMLLNFQALVYSRQLDVVIVTETWLTPDILDKEILPSGFNLYRRDRPGTKRGGGVLVAIKTAIKSNRRDDLELNCEFVACEIYPSKCMKVAVCGFYRPPSTKFEYLQEFNKLLHVLNQESCPLVICGDFNFPEINWDYQLASGSDNLAVTFCEMVNDSFLTQINRDPTRITQTTSSILDLVLTNFPERFHRISTFDTLLSTDHLGISFFMKTPVHSKRFSRTVYNFKSADLDGLKETLLTIPLNVCFDDNDVNLCWERWRDLFLSAVDTFVPKIKINDSKSPKWIDGEIIMLSKKKEKLFRKAKRSNSQILWESYKEIRKHIKSTTKRKYHEFLLSFQDNLKENPKLFWSFYKAKTKAPRIPNTVYLSQEKASNTIEKAELFNRFFCSVYLKPEDRPSLATLSNPPNALQLIQTSDEEVFKLLKAIDPSKASGPDGLPGRLLKVCANEITPFLTGLINMSLRLGQFPKGWKCANIVPIFKKGNSENVSNYRPISLLSLVSKIAERCVYDKLLLFVENKIYIHQHGFVKGRSCTTQLLNTYHLVAEGIDMGIQTDCIFLDFTKAFDSVSHVRLIHKLGTFGIRGPLLQWFTSYLDGRIQRVVLDGEASKWMKVTSGVPQGSIIGPLLFLVFINDMPNSVSDSSTLALFADDAKCLRRIHSTEDCLALQSDIDKLTEWSETCKLSFNIQKCSITTLTRKRTPIYFNYTIRDQTLNRVESQRDLGVLCTSDARFKHHIQDIVSRANKMLGFIRRTLNGSKNLLPTYKSLYIALVRSHLEYASEIWNPKSSSLVKLIEGVQRRATRLLLPELDYTMRLESLSLLPLVYRREVKDLTTFYKMKCGLYKCSFESFICFCSDKRLRSFSEGKLKLGQCRTELYKQTFYNRIPHLWNNLPRFLRLSKYSPRTFTKHCNEFYQSKIKDFNPNKPSITWVR